MVPQGYSRDKELAHWVRNQRVAYKKGTLSQERIKNLEELGFIWDPHDACWGENYKKLLGFKKEWGHCLVPYGYKDRDLAHWVRNQRIAYKTGTLSQEKIKNLEELGFIWDVKEAWWEEGYQKLVGFQKEWGHCLVPQGYKDKALGRWVGTQRQAYKKGRLSQERIKKLEAIGFQWVAKK